MKTEEKEQQEINAEAKEKYAEALKEVIPALESAQEVVIITRHKGGKKRVVLFGDPRNIIMLVGATCDKSQEIYSILATAVEARDICALGERVRLLSEEKMAESVANKTETEKTAG